MMMNIMIASFKTLPQIITVAETWLKENYQVYYEIPNYKFLSLPRYNRLGGGVGVYIANNLSFSIKTELMLTMKEVCEYIVIEMIFVIF